MIHSVYTTLQRPVGSDVEVLDLECVFFDELAARFDIVPHEGREQVVGSDGILEADLEQRTARRVHGRLPKLFGIHLA